MRTALYSPLNLRLCEIMKKARVEAGVTQVELAKATGRTQAYISKFESQQLRLDIEDFIQFCTALRIDPRAVVDELSAISPSRADRPE